MTYGFTTIERKGVVVVITHNGNMSNTVEHSVQPNVDAMLGDGVFNRLRKHGKEEGSPDYAWSMTIPGKAFDELIRTN